MELILHVGPNAAEVMRRSTAAWAREHGRHAVVRSPRLNREGAEELERFCLSAASRSRLFETSLDGASVAGTNAALRAIEEGPGRLHLASSTPPILTIASRAATTIRCPAPTPEEVEAAGGDPSAFGTRWPRTIAEAVRWTEEGPSTSSRDTARGLITAATRRDRPAVRAHVEGFERNEAESLVEMARGSMRGEPPLSRAVARAVLSWRRARPRVLASATAEIVMAEAEEKRRAGDR